MCGHIYESDCHGSVTFMSTLHAVQERHVRVRNWMVHDAPFLASHRGKKIRLDSSPLRQRHVLRAYLESGSDLFVMICVDLNKLDLSIVLLSNLWKRWIWVCTCRRQLITLHLKRLQEMNHHLQCTSILPSQAAGQSGGTGHTTRCASRRSKGHCFPA